MANAYVLHKKDWQNVQRYIYNCVCRYTHDPEQVKDYVQDVIASFLEKNVDISKLTKRYVFNAVRFATYKHYSAHRAYDGEGNKNYQFLRDYEFVSPEEEEDYVAHMLQGIKPTGNKKLHDKVLRLLIEGKTIFEISWMLNRTTNQISSICRYALKKLKMIHNNPINGNKLKITKQISLSTWEKKIDQDDYDYEDGNEFYELYKHKESKDGLLVKLPTAKQNPYIK